MKIPEHIQENYKQYKQGNNLYCQNCKRYAANFTYMSFDGDLIIYKKNCTHCGEDYFLTIPYKKLRSIYLQLTNSKKPEMMEHKFLWWIFELGMYYREVFQHEDDKIKFDKILLRLNRDSKGWRKLYHLWRLKWT